jgi:ABC-type transporter Mla maintaining outer membrane lipid asymmetry ATPase subunit MlaF
VTPLLEVAGVVKHYGGLRPLRIDRLDLAAGEILAVAGLDQPAAEIFVNLLTGTTLPDHGHVRVFGRSTADIEDSGDWMRVVDRFGILSPRAVLLDALTVVQNLAIPFSLDVEPPSPELRARATDLANEVGLEASTWDVRVADLDPLSGARVRLGRALALDPDVLLLEHPNAAVPTEAVVEYARQLRGVIEHRHVSALVLTADRSFADAIARRVLSLEASTGRLTEKSPGWFARFRNR